MISEKAKKDLEEMLESIQSKYEEYKVQAGKDLEIDPDAHDLDRIVLETPKIMSRYNDAFSDETLVLKDLYTLKKKVELERWKFWSGKQSDKYYAENGIVHEKILKADVDKYLSADEKLILLNKVINTQKAICDYLERVIKEIQSRNFHCKVALEWRRFTSGGM